MKLTTIREQGYQALVNSLGVKKPKFSLSIKVKEVNVVLVRLNKIEDYITHLENHIL